MKLSIGKKMMLGGLIPTLTIGIFIGCSSFGRVIVSPPPVVDDPCCGGSQAYRSVASAPR